MFYKRVLYLCNQKGLSVNRLAENLKFANGTASIWKNGAVPRASTVKKIADYFGVPVSYFSDEEEPEEARHSSGAVRIPVLGTVAAGIPLDAITDIDGWEEIPAAMARTGEFAALTIHGRSMVPLLMDGDIVIVRTQEDAETGDIVIATINGDTATCKRFRAEPDGGITLIPENTEFGAMTYSAENVRALPVRIWGKVVEIRRKIGK